MNEQGHKTAQILMKQWGITGTFDGISYIFRVVLLGTNEMYRLAQIDKNTLATIGSDNGIRNVFEVRQ